MDSPHFGYALPSADISSSPVKKRVPAGHFMTPMRRMLFRLEWSKTTQKRRNKLVKPPPNSTGKTPNPVLDAAGLFPTNIPPLSLTGSARPQPVTPERLSSYHGRTLSPRKRSRTSDFDTDSEVESTADERDAASLHGTPTASPHRARVAIQQEDTSLDAIVVTTLPNYPFCSHEDLLRMSRAELITVARAMNARLPANSASQIPTDDRVLEAAVRSQIEALVGIRPPVPMAPKAVKCAQSLSVAMDVDHGTDGDEAVEGRIPSPPSSPLAMREKRRKGVGLRFGGKHTTSASSGAGKGSSDDGSVMDVAVEPLLSPRRFLDRLDELPEPDSDSEGEEDFYEDEDDEGAAMVDPLSAHVVKRRRVSKAGQYARILAVEPGRTLVGSPLPLSPTREPPLFAVPSMRYKFSVPRKPVMKTTMSEDLERASTSGSEMDNGGSSNSTSRARNEVLVSGSDSIDFLFQSGLDNAASLSLVYA